MTQDESEALGLLSVAADKSPGQFLWLPLLCLEAPPLVGNENYCRSSPEVVLYEFMECAFSTLHYNLAVFFNACVDKLSTSLCKL